MELLVKPMVNTFVADPRTSVTQEVIKFVKEANLPKLSLQVLMASENGTMTRLMALKFYKSLFTLLDKDVDLLEYMVIEDPVKACSEILDQLKNRLKNPNMLQSAVLELINTFGESIYKHFGPELHMQITTGYEELSDIPDDMLRKFFQPVRQMGKAKKGPLLTFNRPQV